MWFHWVVAVILLPVETMSDTKAEVSGVEVTLPDGTKVMMTIKDAQGLYDSLGLLFGKEKEFVPSPTVPVYPPPIIIDRPAPQPYPDWPLTHPIITWQGPTCEMPANSGLKHSPSTGGIMCINMARPECHS